MPFKKGHEPYNYWTGKTRPEDTKTKISEKLKARYSDPTKHPQFIGRIKRSGYWYIKVKDHPFGGKQHYIAEHRLVIEKKLGRYLLPQEAVHHKNGDIEDNRLENLELFSSHGEHTKKMHPEAMQAGARKMRGVRPPNYNRGTKTCPICTTAFTTTFGASGKRYCSRQCYWVSKIKH